MLAWRLSSAWPVGQSPGLWDLNEGRGWMEEFLSETDSVGMG